MRGWLFEIRSWLVTQVARLVKIFNPRPAPIPLVLATASEREVQIPLPQPQLQIDSQEVLRPNDDHDDPIENMSEASEDPELETPTSPDPAEEPSETPPVAMLTERAVIQSAQSDSILSVVNGEDGSITVHVRGEQMSLTAALESLLFVADTSVEIGQFVKLFSLPAETIEVALSRLGDALRVENRGIRLQVQNGRYRLVSSPSAANLIETFLNLDLSTRLSAPALESLSVIAYRQPVTRAQIEAVRGVDCGHVLRSLLQRGLIEESGRLETVGRPILYSVTEQFMQHFGLTALNELPPLEATEAARLLEVTEMVEG